MHNSPIIRTWFYAAALLLLASPASAQLTVGTGSAPPVGWLDLGDNREVFSQSFQAPARASALRSISFWFQGSPMGNFWYDTRFLAGFGDCCNDFFQLSLDQSQHGLYTIDLGGVPVAPGDWLFFAFASESSPLLAPTPGASQHAFIQVTGDGAYPPGNLTDMGDPTPYDAVFTATFDATATPEPVSLTLVGTGLAGLGFWRRRRRRS